MELILTNKEVLLNEFKRLYPIHKRKWRSLLKKHNEWHSSAMALIAWQNISKGTTGNEVLRLIIADMQTIAASNRVKKSIKRQGLTRRTIPKQ